MYIRKYRYFSLQKNLPQNPYPIVEIRGSPLYFETEIVVVEHPFLIPKMYQNRPDRCFISKPRLERKHSSPPLLNIGNVLSHRDNLSALLTK